MQSNVSEFAGWLVRGLFIGLLVMLVPGHLIGFVGAVTIGLTIGIAGGLAGDTLEGWPEMRLTVLTTPSAVLARDRQLALVFMLVAGSVAAGAFGLAVGLPHGLVAALAVGFVAGLAARGWLKVFETAWPSYMLTKGWLALCRQLPWPLMDFLADAHRRGILRQAGAVYQFRHIELQHRLANREADTQQANSPAAATAETDG
jgi:hypothetical protein